MTRRDKQQKVNLPNHEVGSGINVSGVQSSSGTKYLGTVQIT